MTSADVLLAPEVPASPGDSPVAAPREAPVELDRLRRNVCAQLFGGPAEPTRIGRFRLLQCIGRGGMGVVWSAQDDELDRTVAIKLLRPELSGQDLTAEARALARLSHPNVVSVFDVGEHAGQGFIAMEFVQGETLRAWLSQPRNAAEIVQVFIAAGRGLAAAHGVGLVHRDFKPDNVLVGLDGRPRVLDFGLARPPDATGGLPPALPPDADAFATTMTHAGLMLGTPAYMAPEQHLGDPADARSDQFAFGVALFEGLTGALPFQGDDLRTLSLSIVRGRLVEPAPGVLSVGLLTALRRALSVDAAERFPSIESLLEALGVAVAASDPSFDTRQVDRVLARAAELQAGAATRPGLTGAEVEAVAVEAGIDPSHARQAVGEALVPPPEPLVPIAPTSTLPMPVAQPGVDFPTRVSVTRTCGPVSPAAAQLLVRRLESQVGKGKTHQLGASTTWRSSSFELHIDPRATGTEIVLQRRLGLFARTRPWRYGLAGLILLVAIVVPVFAEALDFPEAIVVPMVFGSMGAGGYLGRRVARELHARDIERERAELGAMADRLVALAAANEVI